MSSLLPLSMVFSHSSTVQPPWQAFSTAAWLTEEEEDREELMLFTGQESGDIVVWAIKGKEENQDGGAKAEGFDRS